MLAVQEAFIPAGAWLKADGTVDITVGGKVLDGGYGVNMQTAIHALRRYAAQHGPLLMTTLLPDGRSNMDTVHPDGTVKKYESAAHQGPSGPLGHGSLIPATDLDFFGLPPLGATHAPPAGMSRYGRVEAFSDRPVFRPTTHAPAIVDSRLTARPPDRGLGHDRLQNRPAYAATVRHEDAPATVPPGPALSLKAADLGRHRAVSPLRSVGFILVAVLVAIALAVCGPIVLLRSGDWDPLEILHGAANPAPPDTPEPIQTPQP